MEDALSVLGDGAWCRVPVRGAVPPTIGHLKHDSGGEKDVVLTMTLDKIISNEHKQSHMYNRGMDGCLTGCGGKQEV